VIITNSMMVGMFDNLADWEVAAQMGVANYGQMTAAVGCISGRKVSSMGHSIRY
jgi:urocanate hydratase